MGALGCLHLNEHNHGNNQSGSEHAADHNTGNGSITQCVVLALGCFRDKRNGGRRGGRGSERHRRHNVHRDRANWGESSTRKSGVDGGKESAQVIEAVGDAGQGDSGSVRDVDHENDSDGLASRNGKLHIVSAQPAAVSNSISNCLQLGVVIVAG